MIKKLFKNFLIILLFTTGIGSKAFSAEFNFFTIGTGGTAYTYYPVGGMIANAISKPPGSRECGKGGSCGVPNLIASAVSSRGSVDNVNAIISGLRNSGFAQSDVAYWAYTGTGTMEGKAPAKDLRTIAALFQEHIHLIALKDSKINSVKDTESFIIERYSHVMHIVSNVIGEYNKKFSKFKSLLAGFPAGTVSGAPKIRAMEIIDELETTKRKVYAGGIGYFSANWEFDTCIALRTAVAKNKKFYVQAGAGIVADSKPLKEYEETVNKAKALINALR